MSVQLCWMKYSTRRHRNILYTLSNNIIDEIKISIYVLIKIKKQFCLLHLHMYNVHCTYIQTKNRPRFCNPIYFLRYTDIEGY